MQNTEMLVLHKIGNHCICSKIQISKLEFFLQGISERNSLKKADVQKLFLTYGFGYFQEWDVSHISTSTRVAGVLFFLVIPTPNYNGNNPIVLCHCLRDGFN